jgi:hypothetical protein
MRLFGNGKRFLHPPLLRVHCAKRTQGQREAPVDLQDLLQFCFGIL